MRLAHKVAISAAAVGALLLPGAPVAFSDTSGTTGPTETYLVLYKQQAVPADAATRVKNAGGSLVKAYDAIGVAVATSNNSAFSRRLAVDSRVEGATATTKFASKLEPAQTEEAGSPGDLPNVPATDADTFSPLQWDMRQIHTPQAHAITGGSPTVLVGDIDTGLDFTHPDLAANYDAANSADCESGAPLPLLPGNDRNGHGTHTAGTIAAASNGIGIVGVAPNVKIAGIKSSNDDGYFFPEMVVCSFMWAGSHGIDVTNNSYFADPWLFNCKNDPVQRAIWKAEQRAIKYAQQQGVTVVASAGNDSDDVSHPTTDVTSPDFPPETNVTREVTNACVVIPLEIPGVVGVSATGSTTQGTSAGQYADNLKSFYSSYGVSAVDLTAPGGDSIYFTPESVNGRVLSTYSSAAVGLAACRASRTRVDPAVPTAVYCYLQGTSMAGPHVAGVAALIVSRYGSLSSPGNATMQPGKVASVLGQTADPQACPNSLPAGYLDFTGTNSGAVQSCQGGPGHNSWYGSGQADAFNAVSW
ncbi:MAG: S8 family serine peptidase [Sporichthyaceae bacterium]